MPGKISNKLLLAGSILILIAGIAIYLITSDRGRKKEDIPVKEALVEAKDSLVLSEMTFRS
jgi:hypothetical protein